MHHLKHDQTIRGPNNAKQQDVPVQQHEAAHQPDGTHHEHHEHDGASHNHGV